MMWDVTVAVIAVVAAGFIIHRFRLWLAQQLFLIACWHWLSGWRADGRYGRGRRALRRCTGTATAVGLAALWAWSPWAAAPVTLGVALGLALIGVFVVWDGIWQFRHRRTWLRPLHLRAHELAQVDLRRPPGEWLTVERDRSKAVLELPAGWAGETKDKKRLEEVAAGALGMESPVATWRLAGPKPQLTLLACSSPPPYVPFDSYVIAEMANCAPDELFVGIGVNDEPVRVSLATDSPHLAIAGGTGGTKSNIAGFFLLQLLVRGGIGMVLDAKRRLSYPWLLKDGQGELAQLPCVGYGWTVNQLHEGMSWLPTEMDRRGDVAFAGMDTRGLVHATVGARMFTLAEELNMAVPRLRQHWAGVRQPGDPAKSPAFTGLAEGAFTGRQVLAHMLLVGQMLTAEVTGSRDSAVREQCGIKLLCRYGQPTWRALCGDIPMAPSPDHVGRWQVVTGRKVRQVQTPHLDPVAARRMVLESEMAQLPPGMPRSLMAHVTVPALVAANGVPPAAETVSATVAAPRLVTLKEAVASGELHPLTTEGGLMMQRHRDRDFPVNHGKGGKTGRAYLYELAELAAYDAERR
jgi:hypothetical protein